MVTVSIDSEPQAEGAGHGTGHAERPATMKALVQEGTGSADVLHLRDVAVPAIEADRVLVKVRAASVNALDWHTVHTPKVIQTLMGQKDFPIRGVDLSGVVEAVGPNVDGLRPGDEVFGMGRGTFAQYATAPARGLVTKPAGLSFAQAAAAGASALTALQGLRDHAQLVAGQRVLIYGGGGGVGTFAVQIAKALGLHVTAVTGPRNLETVRALGADEVIDYAKEDVLERPARYDAVLDIAAVRPVGALRRVLTPTGIFVQVGASKTGGLWGIFGRIIALGVRRRFLKQRVVMIAAKTRQADLLFLKDLIEAGNVRPIIDREFPLTEAAEAVRYLGTGQARAKVVVRIS